MKKKKQKERTRPAAPAPLRLEDHTEEGERRRRPFEPHEKQREFVMLCVSSGLSDEEIAEMMFDPITSTALPITVTVLRRHFDRELRFGPTILNVRVAKSIFNQAVGVMPIVERDKDTGDIKVIEKGVPPNIGAGQWWESTRPGYQPGQIGPADSGDQDDTPEVVVLLPRNGRELDAENEKSPRKRKARSAERAQAD